VTKILYIPNLRKKNPEKRAPDRKPLRSGKAAEIRSVHGNPTQTRHNARIICDNLRILNQKARRRLHGERLPQRKNPSPVEALARQQHPIRLPRSQSRLAPCPRAITDATWPSALEPGGDPAKNPKPYTRRHRSIDSSESSNKTLGNPHLHSEPASLDARAMMGDSHPRRSAL
jgi:hypothetical protein